MARRDAMGRRVEADDNSGGGGGGGGRETAAGSARELHYKHSGRS
jgi:hypothetical protein